MKNVWLLLKVQLSAMLGLNKILHMKDPKERRKKLIGTLAIYFCMLLLIPAVGLYAYIMGEGMNALGQIGLFPGVVLACTCLMTLISSLSMANGTLFAYKDYDLIMSLPVRKWEIALSRILLGYICGTMIDFLIMIPCGAVYAHFVRPPVGFYPVFFLTMLAAPIVPMVIGSVFGIGVARLMARIRGGKYLQMLGATALSLGIMTVSFNMDSLMEGGIFGDIGVLMANAMNRFYPLTGMYTAAVHELNWLAAAGFILISAAAMAGMTMLTARFMSGINTALTTSKSTGRFRMRGLNSASPLAALYKKELRRYLSSVMWLFNTAFGLLLALIGVGVLAVKGRDMIGIVLAALEIAGLDNRLIVYAIGYVGAFIVITSCTTSCSISMEGKNLWLIQTLPVFGFSVLMSKIMVCLTLTVPTSLIIGVGVGLTLRMTAYEMAAVTAMALSYSVMSASVGLLINLKSHNFEWTTETTVVKQSASVGIAMLVNMVLVVGPAVATFLCAEYSDLIFWGTIGGMAAISAALMVLFRVKGDRMIHAL